MIYGLPTSGERRSWTRRGCGGRSLLSGTLEEQMVHMGLKADGK